MVSNQCKSINQCLIPVNTLRTAFFPESLYQAIDNNLQKGTFRQVQHLCPKNETEATVTLYSPTEISGQYIFLIEEKKYDYFYDFGFIFASGIARKNFDEWSDIIL